MFYSQTIKIAFFISLTGHVLLLGLPINIINNSPGTEEYITVHIENPKLLPKIEKIGEEKKPGNPRTSAEESLDEQTPHQPYHNPVSNIEKQQDPVPPAAVKKPLSNEAEEAMFRYQDRIKQQIEEARWYPKWAKKNRYEGNIRIKFTIYSNGTSGNITIVNPSEHNILNTSAIETIEMAGPFPPIPEEINLSSVTIEVSIVYLLK